MENTEQEFEASQVEIDNSLIDAFKAEFGGQESSLTEQQKDETPPAKEQEVITETDKNAANETAPEEKEVHSGEYTQEDYLKLKEELEQLKQNKEKVTEAPQVDLNWFKTDEGRLWQMDLENLELESEWEGLLIDKLVEEGFTEQEAQEELQDRYPELYDNDIDEEDAGYKKSARQALKEARIFLEKLKERQKAIEIPFKQIEEAASQQGLIANEEEFSKVYTERLTQDYQKRANTRAQIAENLFKGKTEIGLKFGDVELKYQPTPEVIQKAKETLTHLENIGSTFADTKENKIKENELIEFLLFKHDRQTLLDMYANVKVSKAKEELVNSNLKNTNFEQKSTKSTLGKISEDDPDFAIIQGLANGRYR